eukprot:1456232-Alexandrium_andersonii.AAC.1
MKAKSAGESARGAFRGAGESGRVEPLHARIVQPPSELARASEGASASGACSTTCYSGLSTQNCSSSSSSADSSSDVS